MTDDFISQYVLMASRPVIPITKFVNNENDEVQKAARELRFKYGVTIRVSRYAYDNIDQRFIDIVANETLSSSQMTSMTVNSSDEAKKLARTIRFR